MTDNCKTSEGYLPLPKGFATVTIRTAQDPEQWGSWCVVPPLVTSVTFKQPSPANPKKFIYSRCGNPNRNVLEEVMAKLEGAKYGLCFASGLGAITTFLTLFKSGDHIIYTDDLYGGTKRLMLHVAEPFGIHSTPIDTRHLDLIEKAINENTKAIWLETPTNPTLKIMDIRGVAALAKKHNLLLAVDNTFLTPYLQRPLELGADIVVHSMTKYLNGHSDVIMGAIVTSNEKVHERLRYTQNSTGIVPSPFDCYMVNRSLKTLALRMNQHSSNSLTVAKFLETHPKIQKVLHPGLESHPQHKLFKSQTSGHSGMLSFYLEGGLDESKRFLSALKIFMLAESLGGYESLAELPATMTHASVAADVKKALNITDNLIRLSVGLEDVEDLIDDLTQALETI